MAMSIWMFVFNSSWYFHIGFGTHETGFSWKKCHVEVRAVEGLTDGGR